MTAYTAPIADIRFVMEDLCHLEQIAQLPGLEQATPDLVAAVLEEAAKLAGEVLAPINRQGDIQGARLIDGSVITADGWKEAYTTFIEGGWNGAVNEPEWGGMGLPWVVNAAIQEMIHSANMAFALCPMLTQGAIEAISLNGCEELKQRFLPKMVSGEWTGTMNLTEPQAGSDLSAVRTRAERLDGHYLISGQKIFITYGEHDLTDNIIHLVLARTPDAPPGVRGISLFVVPKFILDDNGAPGRRNDVHCVSIEHKLGIHGSPTAVLSFGDHGGAVGYLVGEENRGLEYMFVMMNLERLVVGIQGLGISERAYQQAVSYARERIQGQPIGTRSGERMPIIHHPSIRRKLMAMRAEIEAMRALAYAAARASDLSSRHPDADARARNKARLDLLTPVVKGWCTERSVHLTSIGFQVHGGMGYIEETGVSQHFRDARITTIYEGTTAIQANDLVGRKIVRDGARSIRSLLDEMRSLDGALASNADASAPVLRAALQAGIDDAARVVEWLLDAARRDPRLPAAASANVLQLFGTLFGGYEMARAALAASRRLSAGEGDPKFMTAKIITARYYAEHVMPAISSLTQTVVDGSETVLALDAEAF
jgi:alkylation response protein AidB-like acyl-CoA dehydrogenase